MKPALLVINMQNDFRKGASAYSCEMLDSEIVFTQHTIKPDKSDAENGDCVRATAEAAYARNCKLVLVSDCCGANSFVDGFSAEQANDFTLKELKERTYDTQLLTLDEIKDIL